MVTILSKKSFILKSKLLALINQFSQKNVYKLIIDGKNVFVTVTGYTFKSTMAKHEEKKIIITNRSDFLLDFIQTVEADDVVAFLRSNRN